MDLNSKRGQVFQHLNQQIDTNGRDIAAGADTVSGYIAKMTAFLDRLRDQTGPQATKTLSDIAACGVVALEQNWEPAQG